MSPSLASGRYLVLLYSTSIAFFNIFTPRAISMASLASLSVLNSTNANLWKTVGSMFFTPKYKGLAQTVGHYPAVDHSPPWQAKNMSEKLSNVLDTVMPCHLLLRISGGSHHGLGNP